MNNKSNTNRRWPIDPPTRYNFKYHQRRGRTTRRNQPHHHHDHQGYCRSCVSRPQMPTSGSTLAEIHLFNEFDERSTREEKKE
jgi:hypothetical protein